MKLLSPHSLSRFPPLSSPRPGHTSRSATIVNFAPGGTTDILGRMVSAKLAEAFGQPGGSGEPSRRRRARSAPSCSPRARPTATRLAAAPISSHAINVSLYSRLAYDPIKDFTPITMLATLPNMLVIHPSIPASNVQELIVFLKANPNKQSFGSAGNGTSQHMSARCSRP
jgi:tripartite-type tricarboxylate transporter receptor subunit TctC